MKLGTKVILLFILGALLVASTALLYMNKQELRLIELTPQEAQWLQAHAKTLRIAPLPDSPPIDFVNKSGRHLGLTSDYIQLIEQQLGISFVYVECTSWKEILSKLEAREIDLVGSIQNTDERQEFLNFTEPYLNIPNIILARKDTEETFNLDNMDGLSVAIVDGSATHTYLSQQHPEYTLVPVKDAATGFRKVSLMVTDTMIADLGVASYSIEDLGISNLRIAGDIDYSWELCLGSRNDWPILNSILEKALASIPQAKRRSIRREWITLSDTQIIPRDRYLKIIGVILLITLLAIGSITLWNRILHKQVTHRTHELGRMRKSHERTSLALGESEERFRGLVESSSDMIWEMDRFGNYTYVSPRSLTILGIEPSKMIGQSALTLMIPSDTAKNLQILRKASPTSIIESEINTHVHTRTGKEVILETSGMAFADNTGKLGGFRGVSRDITERVTAEGALRQSEERFRNLVETTSDWIWEIDIKGTYIYASPQVNELLGYSAEELVGQRFMDLMPPREAKIMEEQFVKVVEQGAPIHSLINVNQHKNGRIVVFETSAVPFYDKEWNIMGYRGIGRDITDRMAVEKQLAFERDLFRSFMEHAPDLIFFKDEDGYFIEVNTAYANEVHLQPDEVIGKTDFDFLPIEQAEQRLEEERAVMQSEKPIQHEERVNMPDGERWYLSTRVPRYDEKGKVVGTFGTSWDITYRKRAEEELRTLRVMLSNIIDSMPSILVGVDVNGKVTQWNREAERVTQITAPTATGKQLSEVLPRLAKEMVKVERAIRERATQKEERILVKEENRTRYNDITVYPLLENNAEGAVIRLDDVTDRVLIEDSIRNIVEGVSSVGRQFFNSMVNQLVKSLDTHFAFIGEFSDDSHTTMRTIAYSKQGQSDENFEFALAGTPFERTLGSEIRIYCGDVQEQFPNVDLLQQLDVHSYIGIPLVDSEENAFGIMVAMYQEPIEHIEFATSVMQVFAGRTAAELERLHATKELLTLRNLLSNIINSMPSILVGVDAEGRVMQWNREAERITGTDAVQAQGKLLQDVFPDLGSEMDRVLEAIGNRELQHDERIPCIINNEPHYTDVTVYPLTTDGTEGAVIRVDDVTDRVRIEEMMVQSEKMMSVGGLAAGMAHEINNPLAGILQNLQVMRNRITHSTDRNLSAAVDAGTTLEAIQTYMDERGLIKMMDSVTEAGRRAAKIVDNMLSFSRKDEAHFEPNNLEEILERSLELASNDYNLKKRFDFRHIRIDRDYDDTLELIPCEGSQIQQVILNLLSNSAQAFAEHPDESKEPSIRLHLKREGAMALIEVEDNGPGMDEETRKRAFEPFFTTKEVGHGTGLGLSVSYFIITENHGGTMLLNSSPGNGTRFSIRIPFEHRQTMWGLRL